MASRKQFADLDFGEGDIARRNPSRVIGLPLPVDAHDATSKRYVDNNTEAVLVDIARIKTALLMLFDLNVDELDPLPEFLTQP